MKKRKRFASNGASLVPTKTKNDGQPGRPAGNWLQWRNCPRRSLPVALIRNTDWETLNAGLRLLVGLTGGLNLADE